MIKLTVDGKEIEVEEGCTVLQACEIAGEDVPRFCYHDRLSIAGNCRMCLVEVQPGPPKPQASCALPAANGQIISTKSKMVQDARKGVMEFLLINHPLDCPICDQGGECDLQDQAMSFGSDKTRYLETKRAVEEKSMGPLIKTNMTRCIHCTRCVRFSTEVAGVNDLGALGRGENMEITTYLEKSIESELSACVVDLCPVGALTSKPYAFNARPWELTHIETIDVMDALGSNIRVDTKGNQVMRVLPRLNEDINEEWISDKTRYAIDGLKVQRLDRPYIRNAKGSLEATNWDTAFSKIKDKLLESEKNKIACLIGDLVDVEAAYSLKTLFKKFDVDNLDCRIDGAEIGEQGRAGYIFNSEIKGIEDSDALLIVGSNPRLEAAVLNARIRKRYLMGNFPIGLIGEKVDLKYPYKHLGSSSLDIEKLKNKNNEFSLKLLNAQRPMIIVGMGAFTNDNGSVILNELRELAEYLGIVKKEWNGFNILQTSAGRTGALDIGFIPSKKGLNAKQIFSKGDEGDLSFIWLMGVDNKDVLKLKKPFVVYQGHHGDVGAHIADVILPGAAYTEKSATYVNTEGRPQLAKQATFPPGDAKEDWKIIRAFSDYVKNKLPFDDLESLRNNLYDEFPHLGDIDEIKKARWSKFGTKGKIDNIELKSSIKNFYNTCSISRTSETMTTCLNNNINKIAAE
jgi:NADH-quinone oxidoreductase subunit G